MGRPDDDIRDRQHRDEFEKEEEEELLEEEEGFDDLIGQQVDNSAMAGTAEAIRAHRAFKEQESQLTDEMFEILEEQKFVGAPPPLAETQHQQTTADEPDDEAPPPLAAPPDEEDEAALPIGGGESWSSNLAPAPAATEPFVGSSDWLKNDG